MIYFRTVVVVGGGDDDDGDVDVGDCAMATGDLSFQFLFLLLRSRMLTQQMVCRLQWGQQPELLTLRIRS